MAFFDGVDFWTTDNVVGGAAAPAGGGQGFRMHSDDMRALLTKAIKEQDTIAAQLTSVHALYQALPPAREPVSINAVDGPNGVNETGRYYEGHLRYQFNYYGELIIRLQRALGMTEETERQNAEGITKLGAAE